MAKEELDGRLEAVAKQNVTVRNALYLLRQMPHKEAHILRTLCLKLAHENGLLKRCQSTSFSPTGQCPTAECKLVSPEAERSLNAGGPGKRAGAISE